jgi:hypothetical protein
MVALFQVTIARTAAKNTNIAPQINDGRLIISESGKIS